MALIGSGGGGQMEINILDLPFFGIFLLGSLLSLGWIPSFQVPMIGDLATPFYTLTFGGESAAISIPILLSVVGLLGAAATNEWSFSGASGVQIYVVLATLILIVAPPFVPLLDAVLGMDLAGFVVLFVQSWGFLIVSYIG